MFTFGDILSGFLFLCFGIWFSCILLNHKEFVGAISICCFSSVLSFEAPCPSEGGGMEFSMSKPSLGSLTELKKKKKSAEPLISMPQGLILP